MPTVQKCLTWHSEHHQISYVMVDWYNMNLMFKNDLN